MLLDIRPLLDVNSVNSWDVNSAIEIYNGDQQDIYFAVIDKALDISSEGFNPPGRRYCPPTGSVLTVKLLNIDSTQVISRVCSQPFATSDASIFKFTILSSDPLSGTVSMSLTLVEPSRTLNANFAPGVMVRVH